MPRRYNLQKDPEQKEHELSIGQPVLNYSINYTQTAKIICSAFKIEKDPYLQKVQLKRGVKTRIKFSEHFSKCAIKRNISVENV